MSRRMQIDTQTWAPRVISISGDDQQSELDAFAADLLEDVLYVFDRNLLDFDFLRQVLAKNNDFVLRVRDNAPAARVLDELPLTALGTRRVRRHFPTPRHFFIDSSTRGF